jgi:Excalibur calcium-binding domain
MSQYNYGPELKDSTAYAHAVPPAQPGREFGPAFGRVWLGPRHHPTWRRTVRGVITAFGALLVAAMFGAAFSGTDTTTTKAAAASTAAAPTVTTTVNAPAVTTTVTETASAPAPSATSVSPAPTPKAAPRRPAPPKAAPKPTVTHTAAPPPAPAPPVQTTEPPSDVYYANCTAARAAGAAPIYRGEPGYRPALDRDDDGIACE